MSLQTQVGQFTASTGGTQTTVSCNFQGKAIMFWTHGKTAGAESALASWSMGFADASGHVVDHSWASDDNVATTNAGTANNITNALRVLTAGTPTPATGGQITAVSFGPSSFTVTFSATPSAAWQINFVLFGGSDITNTFAGQFQNPVSVTGNQSLTTVGFQGNIVFVIGTLNGNNGNAASSGVSFGVAVSPTQQFASPSLTVDAQTVQANMHSLSRVNNNRFMSLIFTNAAVIFDADFLGFTSTGFNYNIDTASATGWRWGILVIQGGQWDVGVSAKPTTATAQTVTGEAFQPSILGVHLSSATSIGPNTNDQVVTIGASDGTNQAYANAVELDVLPTVAKSSASNAAIAVDRDGANNPTATFTSFNSDGWTITWNNTGAAKEVSWFTGASSTAALTPYADTGDDLLDGPPIMWMADPPYMLTHEEDFGINILQQVQSHNEYNDVADGRLKSYFIPDLDIEEFVVNIGAQGSGGIQMMGFRGAVIYAAAMKDVEQTLFNPPVAQVISGFDQDELILAQKIIVDDVENFGFQAPVVQVISGFDQDELIPQGKIVSIDLDQFGFEIDLASKDIESFPVASSVSTMEELFGFDTPVIPADVELILPQETAFQRDVPPAIELVAQSFSYGDEIDHLPNQPYPVLDVTELDQQGLSPIIITTQGYAWEEAGLPSNPPWPVLDATDYSDWVFNPPLVVKPIPIFFRLSTMPTVILTNVFSYATVKISSLTTSSTVTIANLRTELVG